MQVIEIDQVLASPDEERRRPETGVVRVLDEKPRRRLVGSRSRPFVQVIEISHLSPLTERYCPYRARNAWHGAPRALPWASLARPFGA